MHVRFVSPVIDRDTRVEAGFFRTRQILGTQNGPEWVQNELKEQFDWYNDNLEAPDELGKYFKRRDTIWGICWFKSEAKECIQRAHFCAWLLGEAGIPIRMLKANIRKEIIWQDENQILCKPMKELPRAFN